MNGIGYLQHAVESQFPISPPIVICKIGLIIFSEKDILPSCFAPDTYTQYQSNQ